MRKRGERKETENILFVCVFELYWWLVDAAAAAVVAAQFCMLLIHSCSHSQQIQSGNFEFSFVLVVLLTCEKESESGAEGIESTDSK